MGRLTADPELKTTNSGISLATFSIAIDRRFKNKNGERETDFLNCQAWRQTAEFISKYFYKGQRILIQGTVQINKGKDKNGNDRWYTNIVVDQAEFADSKKDSGGGGSYASQYSEDFAPAPGIDNSASFDFSASDDSESLPFDL